MSARRASREEIAARDAAEAVQARIDAAMTAERGRRIAGQMVRQAWAQYRLDLGPICEASGLGEEQVSAIADALLEQMTTRAQSEALLGGVYRALDRGRLDLVAAFCRTLLWVDSDHFAGPGRRWDGLRMGPAAWAWYREVLEQKAALEQEAAS